MKILRDLKSFLKKNESKTFINITIRMRFFLKIIPYIRIDVIRLNSYLYYWIDARCEMALQNVEQFSTENINKQEAHDLMVKQYYESIQHEKKAINVE